MLVQNLNGKKLSELEVLVVDDNEHMRRLLRSILEALGVPQVREAVNGMTALNDAKLILPDIIITDMMMEPVDGLEFTRLLRDDLTHPATRVPVLMVTGFAEKHVVEAARDAGVSEFLAKPVTVDGVGARLKSVIENPRRFIRSGNFVGPDRRRRQVQVEQDLRQSDSPPQPARIPAPASVGGAPIERGPETTPSPKRRALR